jgi:hypothetical protein
LSHRRTWVDGLEFDSGVVEFHLPVDSALGLVDVGGPSGGFGPEGFDVGEAAAGDTLPGEGAEFVLGTAVIQQPEPTAVFRCVVELDPTDQLSGAVRFKGFVERPLGVRVQVVAHEDHLLASGVAPFQQTGHFDGPVDFRPALAHSHFPPPGERFGEHKNAGGPRPFVLVINPFGMCCRGGNRRAGFLQQLDRLFVYSDHGTVRVIRSFIGFQHVLQAGGELGVGFGRPLFVRIGPVLDLAVGHVFF